MDSKREKKIKIKTNNQELLIRKHNESVATSKCIKFQKTSRFNSVQSLTNTLLQWKDEEIGINHRKNEY
jgi:hypothetical protein